MFRLISSIQDFLVQKKRNSLRELKYKDLRYHERPTELENIIPFDYFIVADPDANDSKTVKEELNDVIRLSNSRTKEVENTILVIDKDPLIIYKSFLNQQKLAFPQQEFDSLYHILYDIIFDLKYYYNRPRPNQIAEFYNIDINVLHTKSHATPSYPSGHVAYAKLAELVIKDTYSQFVNNDIIDKLTEKVAIARIKQGVHFRSDNAASIFLVDKIYSSLITLAKEYKYVK